MPAFVYLAVVADEAAVERVFEKVLEVRYRHGRTRPTSEAKPVNRLSEQGERVPAGGVQFERFYYERRLRLVYDDGLVLPVQITERSHLRPQTVLQFLPDASPDILRKIVHIILRLAERYLEHEFPLRRVLEPKSRELQITELADVEKPDNFAAIHGVASKAVGMPREDTIGKAFLYVRKHFIKDRATRNLGRLLLGVHFHDFNILPQGKLAQFGQLVVNAPHLPLLRVGGLAGVEKKFFGLSDIHIFKN